MKKYKNLQLFLDSPYKWGDGYKGMPSYQIESNENALKFLMQKLGYVLDKPADNYGSCAVYVTDDLYKEIYLHPAEISGTVNDSEIKILIDTLNSKEFKEKFPYTSFTDKDQLIIEDTYIYTYIELVAELDKFRKNKKLVAKLKANTMSLANNEPLREYGFYFKDYCFSTSPANRNIETQRNFIINYFNALINEHNTKTKGN